MNSKTDSFYEIIKYNPAREYMGEWTPNELHNKYNKNLKDPTHPIRFVQTGKISVTMVCDALWNEMLYNPLRFGTKNPFEFNGKLNIFRFFEKYPSKNAKNDDIMFNISYKLRGFVYFIGRTYPDFYRQGEIKDYSIMIKCNNNREPNDGYMALACLVRCIHLIASQNMKDYKKKQYREQTQAVIKQRHPDIVRPNKNINFVTLGKLKDKQDFLYQQILDKDSEITDTKMRIQTLNEYEPPVDTSKEQALLSRQNAELQKLEEQYNCIKKQYIRMISPQKEYNE